MRISPVFPTVLAAAGLVQAFPFVVGRSMEYSVLRRWGAEQSVVTLLPADSSRPSEGGVDWKVKVTDRLVSGVRLGGDTQAVRTKELVLHVADTFKVWTTDACEIPWDMDGPLTNLTPSGKWPWGVRSLACAGMAPGKTASVGMNYRRFVDDRRCDRTSPLCGVSYVNAWTVPIPEGIWNDDSGWISYHDGETGESWILTRIGGGPLVGESRYRVAVPRKLGVGDRWIWLKTVDRQAITYGMKGNDTVFTSDTTRIEWTALERIGDTGAVGVWMFSRDATGGERRTDRVKVDFDTPLGRLEVKAPADPALAVFRREATPLEAALSEPAGVEWSASSASDVFGTTWTQRRSYVFSNDGSVSRMVQVNTYDPWGMSTLALPRCDTIVTFSFVSRHFATSMPADPRIVHRPQSLRTMADLERLIANGGRILSIRSIGGARLGGSSGANPETSGKERGVFLFEAVSPEGGVLRGRVLRP